MDQRPHLNPDTLNLIEEKMGISLECTGTRDSLSRAETGQALRSIIDKWDLLKLKNFCKAKDTVNRKKTKKQKNKKRQPTEWEKIFKPHI